MRAIGLPRRFRVLCLGLLLSALSITPSWAETQTVALPSIKDSTISPRIIYVENPQFPQISDEELRAIVQTATVLVAEHFGVTLKIPSSIGTFGIDEVFKDLFSKTPDGFQELMGDFRGGDAGEAEVPELQAQEEGQAEDDGGGGGVENIPPGH